MRTALLRFMGSAQNKVGVSANGGTGAWYGVGDFIDLSASATLIFSGRCVIRVRGIAAGGQGGNNGFVDGTNGGGGGQGARNEIGVPVTITPDGTYVATVASAASGTTQFDTPTTTMLQLLGGAPGLATAPNATGGAGGVATVGAGGVNGEAGASNDDGGSPANGNNAVYAGASGGRGNDGGAGGNGGATAAGPGQPGGPVSAPHSGGSGRAGAPFVLTGAAAGGGQGAGGQGAGNVANGEIGPSLYVASFGLGRLTIEFVSIG